MMGIVDGPDDFIVGEYHPLGPPRPGDWEDPPCPPKRDPWWRRLLKRLF